MNPKEKADRLCMDMLLQIECNCQPSICKMIAKQCALIAVDEMIELCESYVSPYYYEVKKEIEKL